MVARRIGGWTGGYPLAATMVGAVAVVFLPLRGQVPVSILLLTFVPVIVMIARLSGVAPSLFASFLTVTLVDVVYTRPYLHITVSDPTEWVALVAFLAVALVAGGQTGRLREREQSAVRRRDELAFLNQLLFSLASEGSLTGTARLAASRILTIVPASRVSVYSKAEGGDGELLAENGDPGRSAEPACVRWVLSHGKAIGLPGSPEADQPRPVTVDAADSPPEASHGDIFVPLQTVRGVDGVLYVRVDIADPEDTRAIVAISNLLGALLERHRVEVESSRLAAEREAERLKATLVSSVSHELKTPLAAATAHVSGLLSEVGQCDRGQMAEELGLVADELDRLNVSISDLLDLARLETASWKPRPDTYEISEVLATSLSRLADKQQKRVRFSVPANVPFVYVDFTQMVQVFLNILQNALAYSPSDSLVHVIVSRDVDWIRIAVEDEGPGVPDPEKQRIFEKFYRGSSSRGSRGGTGLGLAITKEIVSSAGGEIAVEDRMAGGARFVVSIPAAVIGADDE